jgi:hypothetical protein
MPHSLAGPVPYPELRQGRQPGEADPRYHPENPRFQRAGWGTPACPGFPRGTVFRPNPSRRSAHPRTGRSGVVCDGCDGFTQPVTGSDDGCDGSRLPLPRLRCVIVSLSRLTARVGLDARRRARGVRQPRGRLTVTVRYRRTAVSCLGSRVRQSGPQRRLRPFWTLWDSRTRPSMVSGGFTLPVRTR